MRAFVFLALSASLLAPAQQPAAQTKPDIGDDVRGYTDTPRIPGQPWRVHDAERPRPRKVAPGPVVSTPPPADATVLFDGKDLSQWITVARGGVVSEPKWKVENGEMVIVPRSGGLRTKEKFGDCQIHVEWMIPKGTGGRGQSAGNSGVEIMTHYEIQVLESVVNVTYADGQAASIYGQWPPLVNASRPEGEWNVYDILFQAPHFEDGKLTRPAFVTVIHNGLMVHNHQEIIGAAIHRQVATYKPHAAEEPLSLQDHGHPVHYRNIWIRRIGNYDEK